MKEIRTIQQVFNMKEWEILQASLAEVTGMAIITVDYKGIPVTAHSGCQRFCDAVRKDEKLGQYCQKCDARGGLEAVRAGEPYVYQCHFSIVDMAIPITIDQRYLGAVMAGQVRLSDKDGDERLENIFLPVHSQNIENAKVKFHEEYEEIPRLSYERIHMIAMMLYYLCNYMVKDGIQKEIDYDQKVKKMIAKKSESCDLSHIRLEEDAPKNRIIANALEYIYEDQGTPPSLAALADKCNVSSSYLSRLFTKEVGESYSAFILRLKTEWAKEILKNTDLTVTEVSMRLGYTDVGYFIKVFKKYVGVTPAFYRSCSIE